MQLFRIVRHGRGGSTSYIKDTNGCDLVLPEDKADKYIDWLYEMNGQESSLLVLEEVNERSNTGNGRPTSTA